MSLERAEKIARTVLYEGYMLYPYRPSALKNRQRWNFGTLYPEPYDEVQRGTERCRTQTQCLLNVGAPALSRPELARQGGEEVTLHVAVRFLHLLDRRVRARTDSGEIRQVESLVVDGQLYESWEEGVERAVDADFSLAELLNGILRVSFSFAGLSEEEDLRDGQGATLGQVRRTHQPVQGTIEISAEPLPEGVFRLTAHVTNCTALEAAPARDAALLRSLLSVHLILQLRGGEFISLLDPPDHLRPAAAQCCNVGTYPVLVGEPGQRDLLLSSPLILYDYPQVAPESAGDFFDATEMDEMLTLRVLTLTDDEKRELAGADRRVRQLLERTERTAREQLLRTHGTVRSFQRVEDEAA